MTNLRDAYQYRLESILAPVADQLHKFIADLFRDQPRIDRISVRAKSVDRFLAKAENESNGSKKYSDPLRQIQDQLGARIITFYLSDVDRVSAIVERYFKPIESKRLVPESESEFGYFGKHYVLVVPTDVLPPEIKESALPDFFELQIKTLFQHAWSEANHDLGYKSEAVLDSDAKRRLAFAAAQAWGADRMFDELARESRADCGSGA